MKVALVHYTADGVGGVESVLEKHVHLFSTKEHDALVIARRGPCATILGQRDPLDELRAAVHGCDAVIVHNVLTMPFDLPLTGALWQLAEEMPHIRWIAWIHDIAPCNPDYRHPWHEAPWRRLTQASPHFTYVAVSELRARQFETLTGVRPRVIPNGADTFIGGIGGDDGLHGLAEDHALLSREIVLLHPARLVRRKKIEVGLEVVAELRRRGRDAVILITGARDPHNADSRAYGEELRALRGKLGLENAAFAVGDLVGPLIGRMAQLYQLADALLLPSREEGFGLPVLEAALHRMPIFCTDIEPLNTLLSHGVHTFAPGATPADIATLIEHTLDADPAHRARRETLQRYSWDTIWREHLVPLLTAAPAGSTAR